MWDGCVSIYLWLLPLHFSPKIPKNTIVKAPWHSDCSVSNMAWSLPFQNGHFTNFHKRCFSDATCSDSCEHGLCQCTLIGTGDFLPEWSWVTNRGIRRNRYYNCFFPGPRRVSAFCKDIEIVRISKRRPDSLALPVTAHEIAVNLSFIHEENSLSYPEQYCWLESQRKFLIGAVQNKRGCLAPPDRSWGPIRGRVSYQTGQWL